MWGKIEIVFTVLHAKDRKTIEEDRFKNEHTVFINRNIEEIRGKCLKQEMQMKVIHCVCSLAENTCERKGLASKELFVLNILGHVFLKQQPSIPYGSFVLKLSGFSKAIYDAYKGSIKKM